ncbi:MAG: ATP-binding cassette domain-containing protein, partial [Gemmatimonadales bacterium]
MTGAGGFRAYVESLPERDAPVLIAVWAMVERADLEGRVVRARLATAFRDAYVNLYGQVAREGTPESRRLFEIRRMTPEEVDVYLSEQVLVRLASEGWLQPIADGESMVAFSAAAWSAISSDREGFSVLLEKEVERRLEAPAEAEPAAEPVVDGSRMATKGLVKIYKKRRVVNDVDIELRQGEIVGLLGPNGAGKTTTFYMMVGLVSPDAGEVYLDGQPLTRIPMYRRARRGIGYLAQEPSVFRRLTVEQNIMAILQTLKISDEQRTQRLE